MKTLLTTTTLALCLALLPGCASEPDAASDTVTADADTQAHATGSGSSTPDAATCAAHGAPLDTCFICDESLRDEGRLWCGGHGRYEDRCWDCQPDLRDPERPYCDRHGLYEDECILCDGSRQAAATDGGAPALYCAEHDLTEADCGICHPELAAGLAVGDELLVRLPSVRSAELAGVRHGTATMGSSGGGVDGYAEIDYDRNRMARITPRVDGVVTRVFVELGDEVAADEPLLEIASTSLAAAKREYLDARLETDLRKQERDRARRLHEQEIGSERGLQEAVAAHKRATARVAAAAQALRNLGLSETAIAAVVDAVDTDALLVIRSPFDGAVIERTAVLGEAVDPSSHLLTVADLSRMWLELSLPQAALPVVETGLTVTAGFDALPGRPVTGTIVWVASALDPRTRLLRARAEVPNPDGRLKAGLYGRAEVARGAGTAALTLPFDAISVLDGLPFVLVRRDAGLYGLRRVELGRRLGDDVSIPAGLGATETVVTGGGFTVFSELLKSRFGAGCTEE